jgi:D-apiose dehydrogenase
VSELRFAIFGTGYWARYQLAAWRELKDVRCVALYNRTRVKAEELAREFQIPRVYDDAAELLRTERPDFVDIITDGGTHRHFVELAAQASVPVICQKPMALTLADARAMVATCRQAGVMFLVHENWRWQTPLRHLKTLLDSGVIGQPFRARVTYANSFPVFDNQPALRECEKFILLDMGTHILDTVRMLFGEARLLCCHTARIHPDIRGEDVATVLLEMNTGMAVTCELSYASRVEHDRFPETYAVIEGEKGAIKLGPDYWIRLTTSAGTTAHRHPPPRYEWADPRYELSQSSGVACNADLLAALRGGKSAETTGADNLRTLELVFACYESAETGDAVQLTSNRTDPLLESSPPNVTHRGKESGPADQSAGEIKSNR